MSRVRADISPKGTRMFIFFDQWDRKDVAAVKAIPNGAYSATIGGWRVPLDLAVGRQLRKAYGKRLVMSPALEEWARGARRREREARQLALADDHAIERLELAGTDLGTFLRPYQRAGVALMAKGSMINGDDMGLGKTVTTIAALREQGLDRGYHLVVAPKSSLDSVWADEIMRWVPDAAVVAYSGDTAVENRVLYISNHTKGGSTWIVCTTPMFRRLDWIHTQQWSSFIVDEFHQTGLTSGSTKKDQGSQFFQLAMKIKAERRYGLSGTPIGGQPLRLWSALRWVAPDVFRSKWQWAKQWLEVVTTPFGTEFGGIRKDKEAEFFTYHAPYLLRRKKEDVAPELPPKQRIVIRCDMLPAQRKQYRVFAKQAELIVDNEHLIATNKLTELARLRAFASAECTAERKPNGSIKLNPAVEKGGKYLALMEKLKELGVGDNGKVAVVSTTFRGIATGLYLSLSKHYNCGLIMGGVKAKDRADYIRSFQKGELDIMVMTSRAGGVAITLDRADDVFIVDEDWNPDVQSQLEDRLLRISRIHQVTAYYFRTRGTIEEEINQTVTEKNLTNHQILDLVRQSIKGKR
jgi:SNF2 family DNA or RNA helicase